MNYTFFEYFFHSEKTDNYTTIVVDNSVLSKYESAYFDFTKEVLQILQAYFQYIIHVQQ